MLGATESARRIIEENAKTKELNILAIFDDRLARAPHNIHGVPVIGSLDDLLEWEALPYINRIVVTLPAMANKRKQDFVDRVRLLPNRIAFVVDEFENLNHVQQRLSEIAEISLRDVTGNPKSGRHVAVKRLLDISVSATALVLGAPVLALIALIIRLDSPGPVLFKQPRHGFNNRVFDVYKFRSMRNDEADLKAAQQTVVGDARVTKIGKFIRKTSLDELPQLLNVLKGEMSLVGPRPHAVGMKTEGKESIELVSEYAHRHKVKPGITGWAQINGSRGPLHNGEDVAERVRLDVEYIERSNVLWDIYIILKTLPVLLGDRTNVR
jgi:exopolysaccharide biosynthesis polyprenyl glycosylphosphotransferase